jgi:hypothetical protein
MEAFASRIVTVIGRVRVRGAKIVIRRMHVKSSISRVVAARSNRTVLRSRGLRRVLVLGSWCGRYEVEDRTQMVPREFPVNAHVGAYGGSILLGSHVQPIRECPW